jgi:hypothetical protein
MPQLCLCLCLCLYLAHHYLNLHLFYFVCQPHHYLISLTLATSLSSPSTKHGSFSSSFSLLPFLHSIFLSLNPLHQPPILVIPLSSTQPIIYPYLLLTIHRALDRTPGSSFRPPLGPSSAIVSPNRASASPRRWVPFS